MRFEKTLKRDLTSVTTEVNFPHVIFKNEVYINCYLNKPQSLGGLLE